MVESAVPLHDTPILGMTSRPRVEQPIEYGNAASFWVEFPSGLVDLSRSQHLSTGGGVPPPLSSSQLELPVDGERAIRVDKKKTALVVIDMQKCVGISQRHFENQR